MVNDTLIVLVIIALLVSLVTAVAVIVKLNYFQRRLAAQNNLILENQENIRSLFSGAAGVGEHLIKTEQLIRRIAERQDQLDLSDVANHSYDHAIRLIQNGADCHEIMAQCGLVREEADLLLQMYRYDKAS